jgi:hypothetical protein
MCKTHKENAASLSVIFAPCLIRPKKETVEYTLQLPKVNRIVQFMLAHSDQVFEVLS